MSNKKIKKFLDGDIQHSDYINPLYIDQIIQKDDEWWGSSHNHIQWLFPNPEPSNFNKEAPLLDTKKKLKLSKDGVRNVKMSYIRFLKFLRNAEFEEHNNNHNYLRITRAIKFETYLKQNGIIITINFKKEVLELFKDFKLPEKTTHLWGIS